MNSDSENISNSNPNSHDLEIYFGEDWAAQLHFDETATPTLTYRESWLQSKSAFPISLSMPLTSKVHGSYACFNFFDNLLPEGKFREFMAKAIHADKDSIKSLLQNFNADLPGSLRVIQNSQAASKKKTESTKILVEWEFLNRFLEKEQPTNQLLSDEYGVSFSLAGLQDKFTCQYDSKTRQIFLTGGLEASTHIVKINLKWKNSRVVENEFFCLNLAESVGLEVPEHRLENTGSSENPILILTRYDRLRDKNKTEISRVHQEDFCQVFGTSVAEKYESEGGRSFVEIYNRLRSSSALPIADLGALLDWLCFNFIIGNADSHAKNISVLLRPLSVRLAPFYDLVSTEIYGNKFRRNFAFRLGGVNECDKVRKQNIQILEQELGLKKNILTQRFFRMAERIENKINSSSEDLIALRSDSTIPERVNKVIQKRISQIRKFF